MAEDALKPVSIPPFVWSQLAAEDTRTIVPGFDQHGGLVIYRQGRPAYYCLNGEWFEAISVERGAKGAEPFCDEREIKEKSS